MAALVTTGVMLSGGTVTLLGRVVGWDGVPIAPSSVAAIKYTAYLLQADTRVPISGHVNVNLPVNDVLFGTLIKDATWTEDDVGYNFRYTVDVSANPLATTPGSTVLVAVTLTPTAGQIIRWDYVLRVA